MSKKGRPKIYDLRDQNRCKSCKYWYSYAEMCGYLLMEGHSRTLKDGKRRLPKGKCDKYTEADGKRRESFNYGII